MVPQQQLGFLYQMLFSSVFKTVELKANEKWFCVSVTTLTPAQNFLETIWPLIEILRSLVVVPAPYGLELPSLEVASTAI